MNILPLDIALHLYKQWNSQVKLLNQQDELYTKYLEGKSTIDFKNGNQFIGQIKCGLLNGKGIFKWKNGLIYQGEFKNNLMDGEGKLTWTNGSTYIGQMKQNKKHGHGTYYSKQDDSTYIGQWADDERTGNGKLEFSNKAVYEGQFYQGKKSGKGKMTYPSGNSYQGFWQNDMKTGQGVMIWNTVDQKYIGEWNNNKQNGVGTHVWIDNMGQHRLFRNRYEGEWVDCRRQGVGTFYYHNETKYDGRWKNNKRDGFGILTSQIGKIKIGTFSQDRLIRQNGDLDSSSIVHDPLNFSMDNSILNQSTILNQSSINHSTVNQTINKSIKNNNTSKQNKKSKPLKPLSKKPQLPDIKEYSNILPNKLQLTNLFNKNQVAENMYPHYIDIQNLQIQFSFKNYLLRQHSFIKQLYKSFAFSTNQFYSGMTMIDFIRAFKQMKVTTERCNIATINRLFSKGVKSYFDLKYNSKKLVEFLESHQQLHTVNHLKDIQIKYYAQKLYDIQIQNIEQCIEVQNQPYDNNNLKLLPERNIHQGSSAILFRHFVNLLLITAILKFPNQSIEKATTKLFQMISLFGTPKKQVSLLNLPVPSSSGKLSFQNTSFRSGIPIMKISSEWAKHHNERLFQHLTFSLKSLFNTSDKTVTVRTLFKLLQKTQVLKQPLQKLVFFEKIQKYYDLPHYYFKKEYKQKAEYIISNIQKSEVFKCLLNHELVLSDFIDLFQMTMFKRLSSTIRDAEQLKVKYLSIVQKMIFLFNETKERQQNNNLLSQNFKRKIIPSTKQAIRQQKIKEAEAERIRQQQIRRKQIEQQRQLMQRQNMSLNDCNITSSAYLQQDQDQFD